MARVLRVTHLDGLLRCDVQSDGDDRKNADVPVWRGGDWWLRASVMDRRLDADRHDIPPATSRNN